MPASQLCHCFCSSLCNTLIIPPPPQCHPTLSCSHVYTGRSRQLARQRGRRATRATFFLDFSRPPLALFPPFLIVPLPSFPSSCQAQFKLCAEDELKCCVRMGLSSMMLCGCANPRLKGGRESQLEGCTVAATLNPRMDSRAPGMQNNMGQSRYE